MAHLQTGREVGGRGYEEVIAAICVAVAIGAAQGGGAVVRASVADGAMVRARVVVNYAARAVAKNRNFTGDLRRAWQHLVRARALRRTGDLAATMRHAVRARELGRRAILANGWKLKRAFVRESDSERAVMAGVAVGELDRAVDEIVVGEEFLAAPSR